MSSCKDVTRQIKLLKTKLSDYYTDEVDIAELEYFVRLLREKPNIEDIMKMIRETNIKGFCFKEDFIIKKPTIEYLLYLEEYLDDKRLFSIIEHYNENKLYSDCTFSRVSRFAQIIIQQYNRSFYQYLLENNLPQVSFNSDIKTLVNNTHTLKNGLLRKVK